MYNLSCSRVLDSWLIGSIQNPEVYLSYYYGEQGEAMIVLRKRTQINKGTRTTDDITYS